MQNKRIKYSSFNLDLVKTKKFKTISFQLSFRRNVKKDDLTKINILLNYLNYSCNKYKTKKEMTIKKQDLYGASIDSSCSRYGNTLVTTFSYSILNPKYTEDGMLSSSILFLRDILFDPNVVDGKFDKRILDVIKNNAKAELLNIKNNPQYYSVIRLNEELSGLPSSYRMSGYVSDIDLINEENLFSFYKEFFKNTDIDFSIIGDFRFKEMEELVSKYFVFDTNKPELKDMNLNIFKNNSLERCIVEDTNNKQTKIAIACLTSSLTSKEREFIATLYSIILGNAPESKLFMNVREQKSLAYTISSSFKRSDGYFIISSGISYKNYDEAIAAIKEEMENMKFNITDLELDAAKKLYISVLKETYEYRFSILDYLYQVKYLGAFKIEEAIKEVKNVTKDEIYDLARKVFIDTIFVLKEGEILG